ncbi:MAG: hypothetical protein ACJ8MH_03865 [Povalibacter sp.]
MTYARKTVILLQDKQFDVSWYMRCMNEFLARPPIARTGTAMFARAVGRLDQSSTACLKSRSRTHIG